MKNFILIFALFFTIPMLSNAQGTDNFREMWLEGETKNFFEIQEKMENYYKHRDKGRGSGYKQWKRWEIYNRTRLDAQGNIVDHAKRAFDAHHRYKARNEDGMHRTPYGYWEFIGPDDFTNYGDGNSGGIGRVNVIAFHPTDADIIFAGTPAGGLWKTTNGGASWNSMSDGLPRIGVSGIAISHEDPNDIYILTGDGDGAQTYSIGVLKSTNGGNTWKSTGLTFDPISLRRGYKLLMHPDDADILFAACNNGIYKTEDGGSNWTLVQSGNFTDIEFRPEIPAIMYASRRSSSTPFFISINTGDSWTTAGTTIPTGSLGSVSSFSRTEIAVTPDEPSTVYLVCGPVIAAGQFAGVFKSTNSGLNFSLQSSTPNVLGGDEDGLDARDQSGYDLAIAASPADDRDIVTGGINIYESTNSGGTMSLQTHWLDYTTGNHVHADIHELVYSPLNGNLYCGNDGGIYVSTNNGASWTDISPGLEIQQIYDIAIKEGNKNILLAGAQDNGVNKKYNETNNTFRHIMGGDGGDVLIKSNNNLVHYAVVNTKIYKTVTGGLGYTNVTPDYTYFHPNMIMDPTDPSTVIVCGDSLWRTTNNASSWSLLRTNSTNTGWNVHEMAIGTSNNDRFYMVDGGTSRDQLITSSNFTNTSPTFTTISGNPGWFAGASITDIAVDPGDSRDVFVSCGGYTPDNKVMVSKDAGATWSDLHSSTLPNVPINCIAYEPGTDDGVYVGTDIGVFYYKRDLGDWVPFRNWLPTVPVFDLEIDAEEGLIYAATFGRGVWKSELYSGCTSNLTLTGNAPDGYGFYKASNSITSTRDIDGGIGTVKVYQAGNSVTLEPGFECVGTSVLHAFLASCGTAGIPDGLNRMSGYYDGTMDGVSTQVVEEVISEVTETYVKAFPNPLVDKTHIEFSLQDFGAIDIYITDLDGRLIKQVIDEPNHMPGTFSITVDLSNQAAGTYFCNYSAEGKTDQFKLIKIR